MVRCQANGLIAGLLALTTAVSAFPYIPRSLDLRDAGGQSICVPISPILRTEEDLKAKVRHAEDNCPNNQVRPTSKANASTFKLSSAKMAKTGDDYSCGEDNPCDNGACCAKSGYCGYGEKYCGKTDESPNDVCWSNCEAKAECGRFAVPKGKECPLNVCCSPFGFCGMTEEFCNKSDDEDDEESGCQSNCDQPGSGSSGGDVQQRIIGYYEAWNHNKKCMGMKISDIPTGSLTHIYYSFGFIKPESYDIVPMEGEDEKISTDTFTEFAGLKRKNPALKVIMALGGWSFNDNDTIWQPVFSDIVSSKEKRSKFIGKVEDFMMEYGFDGIDIDWEYPGATDRGGNKDDGINLTQLLKEMRKAFDKYQGKEISFTAPTSYWYMRHFDIKASVDAVDFVNLMAYDLHGIWDADNPIGSQVLAHTNITEIDHALDLLWRNDIPAGKVNMGIGFYGRSFQLADPSCYQPGCLFKGGASPGPCTDNSGTLSYKEIMEIIDKNDLTPYYDKESGVKWITWGGDQWVSFDDFDTIQQKIDYANSLGLGGLLIWAIDQDTVQLDALSAVIHPKHLGYVEAQASLVDNWADVGPGQCYTTECGSRGCKSGYVLIERSQCTSANFWTGSFRTMDICCPFASAPNPKKCTWRGGDPFCNGRCHAGEVALASSKFGYGGFCNDGRKFFCCEAEAEVPDCRWTGCGESCSSDENDMTWRSGGCGKGKKKRFCCSKQEEWKNCDWHGKPGNCFDNHCDTGWQVSLTTAYEGEGHDCGFWHSERQRSFCCDPPDDSSPFMPVPLEYLFENPPPAEEAHTDFELKVDPTWGGATSIPFAEEPDNAPFGFVVLTSPEELQVSLDKRDGSHWEVFDCFDAISEKEHTVRMTCTDISDESNCGKIHMGHGAVGTIIQMPRGCGPGKYAVTKSLEPSQNQSLPEHLTRRGLETRDTVYDLTFDYNFRRVPRDRGDTLMRIDYSNDLQYWDGVVDKAADTKKRRKRSLHEVNGNHRRWLEEEWRDDVHFGGLSKDNLHKRWFGSDVVNWLKKLLGTVQTDIGFGHQFSEDFVLQIIDQKLECPNVKAHLDVHAETHVEAKVNYGFTLIAKLEDDIDLSNSYLYFRSRGEASAKFVVDGAVTAFFDTGDVLLLSADKFGAAFAVPGIVTIGPNFKLFGQLEGQATLGVNFESRVKLADWDIQQTYPVANDDWEPEAIDDPSKDGTQNMLDPEFEYGLSLSGHLSAHIKPTITFGIDFNKDFLPIDSCTVNLVADGHVTFHAEGKTGSSGTSFCYGIDAGADLYATIEAPSPFAWALPKSPFPIIPIDDVQLYPEGNSPACWTPSGSSKSARSINSRSSASNATVSILPESGGLKKRAKVYGPLVPQLEGLSCPNDDIDMADNAPCPYCSGDIKDSKLASRAEDSCWFDPDVTEERCPSDTDSKRSWLEKRSSKKLKWTYNGNTVDVFVVNFPSCGRAAPKSEVEKWYGFDSSLPCAPTISKLPANKVLKKDYVTEHVYEAQTLKEFMLFLQGSTYALPNGYKAASNEWVSEVLISLGGNRKHSASTWSGRNLWEQMSLNIGSSQNLEGLVLADAGMNGKKEKFFGGDNPTPQNVVNDVDQTKLLHRSTASVFYYMRNTEIWDIFKTASQGMEVAMHEFDNSYKWGSEKDEPERPTRATGEPSAGLRDLYCYWIEMELGSIETRAAIWHTSAKTNFETEFKNSGAAAKNWLSIFSAGQSLSKDKMKFSTATNQHSKPNPKKPDIWKESNYDSLWKTGTGYGAAVVDAILHFFGLFGDLSETLWDKQTYHPSSTLETKSPYDLNVFGPTTRAPLGYVVYARSGDKGSNANVGFFVRHADEWDWLRSVLSIDVLLVANSIGVSADYLHFYMSSGDLSYLIVIFLCSLLRSNT